MLAFYEMKHFCLGAAGAVDHAVDGRTHLLQELFDYRGICAGGRQDKLAGIERRALHLVGQPYRTAVSEFAGHAAVICLGYLSPVWRANTSWRAEVSPLLPMPPLYSSSYVALPDEERPTMTSHL